MTVNMSMGENLDDDSDGGIIFKSVHEEYYYLEKMLEQEISDYGSAEPIATDEFEFGEQDAKTAPVSPSSSSSSRSTKEGKKEHQNHNYKPASSGPRVKIHIQTNQATKTLRQEKKPMGGPELRASLSALRKDFIATRQPSKGRSRQRSGSPELRENFGATANGASTSDHDDASSGQKTKVKVEKTKETRKQRRETSTSAPDSRSSSKTNAKSKTRPRWFGTDRIPSVSRTPKHWKKRKETNFHDQDNKSHNTSRSSKHQPRDAPSTSLPNTHDKQRWEQPTTVIPDMNNPKTHYDVLGLWQYCTGSDIKKAYRKMALKYHPDRNKDADSTDRFRCVQEAYDTLCDDIARATYDAEIKFQQLQAECCL